MNSTRLSQFCDRALEAGWLLGVTITPVFFNVYSSRVFEPDKLTTLRALATVMAVLWLTRYFEERTHGGTTLRFSMKTPLVLPAVLTMVVYLLSSLTSLVRFTSILGSYQRLQGTYTLFGYLVIFFAILTGLRTRIQLSRLITVLILNSLPVSLYGIVQHNGLDPLPWAGDVTSRVASNMGNAIFVAAYLIMIVPLTGARIVESFGDILRREEARVTDVLRASGYIFIFAVQLLTIWYSQSRGPWLGLVASGFLFPYLALVVLQRQRAAEDGAGTIRDLLKGFAFGLGSLAAAGTLAALAFWALEGQLRIYVALGLALLAFGGLWLYFIVERKGWRWLWIGWGSVGLVAALGLVALNMPGPLQTHARKVDVLQRLTTITELQSGTGKVRGLIWQGSVDLVSPHAPLSYPDGSSDRFNPIRPLVGYGPESMYVAYNSFYPPELGHYESRTASPDRSHNETLDSLVITGILGLAVYLFTIISFFGWGFHWLGLLKSRRDLIVYLALDIVFSVAFFIIGWQLEGAYLFAVAIPLGVLVGTMAYLTLQAFRSFFSSSPAETAEAKDPAPAVHPHAVLLIGLLAGVIAHFVESNFGIAIAATRTTFWAFAGLLVALGLTWIPGSPKFDQDAGRGGSRASAGRRGRRRTQSNRGGTFLAPWSAAVSALALAALFLLGTLEFDFINNPSRLSSAGEIFVRSLTMKYYPTPTRAYGALMIFVFTWVLFGIIGLCEFDRGGLFDQHRGRRWLSATALYAGITLVGFLIFGTIVAGHQAMLTRIQITSLDEVVDVADTLSGLVGRYYGLILVVLAAMGLVLVREEPRPRRSAGIAGLSVLVVLFLVSIPVIRNGCYNLIRADIIFKQGGAFANSNSVSEKQVGIEHFERSIAYAPHEDYYYLFLGKAYLELAQGLGEETSADQREAIFVKTEDVLTAARETNPLNTDHSANLARFYKSWAARVAADLRAENLGEAEIASLQARRRVLLQQSLENYEIALTLSPHNPILWNELAQLYAIDLGDQARFEETIAHSLEVDEDFEQTWMLLGDLDSSQGDIDGAIEAYLRSLEIKNNCTVRRVVGTLYAQQSRWDESAAFLESSVAECETAGDLWEMYRILAITYANQGAVAQSLETAEVSLGLAPADQKPMIQQMIDQLLGSESPVEEDPATGVP
ncbi:MAG: O-antigen ligase family protein [Anaerolineae bacterium]|nr:O-antigen ligase family protein [Anaerolineae bacterium]